MSLPTPSRKASASPAPSSTSSVFSNSNSSAITVASSVMSASPMPEKQIAPSAAPAPRRALPASILARNPSLRIMSVKSELSFCIATSLAFFHNLSWEQTPWIPQYTETKTVNPLTPEDALKMSGQLKLDRSAVSNALFFGKTSLGLQLFVIFPDARSNPATDERFMTIWHDQIVRPAFNHAWKASGLMKVHGAEFDSLVRILPPSGTRTNMDAQPAEGYMKLLRHGKMDNVTAKWPSASTKIMHEAWESMTGMLRDHPDLADFQNPMLLAVYRAKIELGETLSTEQLYKAIAKEWDGKVNPDYVKRNSFGVELMTYVGRDKEEGKEEEGLLEVEGKRKDKRKSKTGYGLDDDENGEEEDNHRNKRRK